MNVAAAAQARLALIGDAVRAYAPTVADRDPPFIEAAVAVVLRATPAGAVELLFIKRAPHVGDPWSGQIALPGGRRDPADASLEATAVRETLEEVALDLRPDGCVLGALDELRPRTPALPPVIVRPFVAIVPADAIALPSDEVAELFWAPLDTILHPASTRASEVVVRDARLRRDAVHYGGHVIWGMTERILRSFGEIIG